MFALMVGTDPPVADTNSTQIESLKIQEIKKNERITNLQKQVGVPTKARAGLFKNRVAQFWMASVGFTNGGLVRLAV